MKETFKVLFTYEQDPETGEIKTLNREVINTDLGTKRKTKTSSRLPKDTDPNPKITLESNKLVLNAAAAELMGISPEDRVELKYEKIGTKFCPIIGNQTAFGTSGGNRVTKSLTISFRGKAHDRLAEYGEVFTITAHTAKSNVFMLHGNHEPEEVPQQEITVDDPDEDINLDELIGNDTDNNTTVMSAVDFNNL